MTTCPLQLTSYTGSYGVQRLGNHQITLKYWGIHSLGGVAESLRHGHCHFCGMVTRGRIAEPSHSPPPLS